MLCTIGNLVAASSYRNAPLPRKPLSIVTGIGLGSAILIRFIDLSRVLLPERFERN